jgi:hypothetical protein
VAPFLRPAVVSHFCVTVVLRHAAVLHAPMAAEQLAFGFLFEHYERSGHLPVIPHNKQEGCVRKRTRRCRKPCARNGHSDGITIRTRRLRRAIGPLQLQKADSVWVVALRSRGAEFGAAFFVKSSCTGPLGWLNKESSALM